MTTVRDRPLDHATQAKLDRFLVRQANKDRLAKIKLALARINQELAQALAGRQKQVGGPDPGESFEDALFRRLKSLRADLDLLEV
jgi:hypothetical protein